MNNLVQLLVSALVPVLMQVAESLLNVQPQPNDPSWVAGLIAEMVGLVQKYIPSWLAPSVQEVEALVAAEIEKLLGQEESSLKKLEEKKEEVKA